MGGRNRWGGSSKTAGELQLGSRVEHLAAELNHRKSVLLSHQTHAFVRTVCALVSPVALSALADVVLSTVAAGTKAAEYGIDEASHNLIPDTHQR